MAMPDRAADFVPEVQIEAVQSVPPFKVTDPRVTRQVSVTDPIGSKIFQGIFNIVLYYKRVKEQDSGWLVAGWIRESLGRALVEQPILGGRLRGSDNEGGNAGELEIVSNDSGVRIIEAKIVIPLQQFLELQEKEKLEAELLVFWKDIDEQNPQFCPLLYVQVTNFGCGGYSIGISCSLLVADILTMDNFLLKWANIHKELISTNVFKVPPFYVPNLKTNTSLPSSNNISSTTVRKCGKTMLFKIAVENLDLKNESCQTIALLCVQTAERKLGYKISSDQLFLLMKESSNFIKVQSCKNTDQEIVIKAHHNNYKCEVTSWSWGELEMNKVAFGEENMPAQGSCWIGSLVDNGLALAIMEIPSNNKQGTYEVNVITTNIPIPCKDEI